MREEQALLLQGPEGDVLPFDPAILTGQLRPSSIAMYRRDLRAYLAYAEDQGLDALQASTFLALAYAQVGLVQREWRRSRALPGHSPTKKSPFSRKVTPPTNRTNRCEAARPNC